MNDLIFTEPFSEEAKALIKAVAYAVNEDNKDKLSCALHCDLSDKDIEKTALIQTKKYMKDWLVDE
jgi:hypothetical protein